MRGHVLLLLAALALPLNAAIPWKLCGTSNDNYTTNSTYQANVQQLSSTLPKNASSSPTLFATATVGSVPNKVYAIALCRGDADASACGTCIAGAVLDAQQLCPYNKDVFIYYDPCYIRFSNQNFLASTDNAGQAMVRYNSQNITGDVSRYDRVVTGLLNATADYAAANSTRRFATGEVGFDAQFPTIYSLAQCTPDLSPAQCRGCLSDMVGQWWKRFARTTQGSRMFGTRCNMRVEVYSFYSGPAMLQLPTEAPVVPGTPGGEKTSNKTGRILAIVLPVVAAILAATVSWFCFWRRPANAPLLPSASHTEGTQSIDSLILDISTLRIATDNFSENNKLGEGGFGVVYKGSLPDGQEIAVKRLSKSSGQGMDELKNELILVVKLQHKNLVRLVGVCLEEHEKLLVYEYIPNRSLDTILFDPEKNKVLDWGVRFKIINGIARGLQYLHEDSQLKIVHRDLKASNILLDSDYNPKISDFGLARLFGVDQLEDVTKRIIGTYGYMSPEYAMRGQYSLKSDVFSFGVLLLEIITGRKNSGSYNSEQSLDLLSLMWENWTMGTIAETVDSSLGSHSPGGEILKCVHIGLICVQENPAHRPTMSTVNLMLSDNTVSLQTPSRPAFCIQKSNAGSDKYYSESYVGSLQSTGRSIPMSPNEVSITELEPR